MKTVKNNPKAYKKREVAASVTDNRNKSAKEAARVRFLDAPISPDLYIELGELAGRKA